MKTLLITLSILLYEPLAFAGSDAGRIAPMQPAPTAQATRGVASPTNSAQESRPSPDLYQQAAQELTAYAQSRPNDPLLWKEVRSTMEDYLAAEWKAGRLLGQKPSEAFFIHCDSTTMTQTDFKTGKLICLVGVALTRPAQFEIFKLFQQAKPTTAAICQCPCSQAEQ